MKNLQQLHPYYQNINTVQYNNVSHPHCIHQVREGEVLMAKNSPTVPDGEEDVVSGKKKKEIIELPALGASMRLKLSLCFCDASTIVRQVD